MNPTGDSGERAGRHNVQGQEIRMMKWRHTGCTEFKQNFITMKMAEAALLLVCALLFLLIKTSMRLYSQDRPASVQFAATVLNSNLSPDQPILVQELPYCELGYGSCGGQCSSEEGKKQWTCPANALPCHHEGQRCTCEAADMCKPKKKKSEHSQ